MDTERILKLISETKMVGRFGITALLHPANYPDANLNDLVEGGHGLRVACNIAPRYPFLFHDTQTARLNEDIPKNTLGYSSPLSTP